MGARVISPLDYQVFQRDGADRAVVPIVIEAPRAEGHVEARLLLQPTHTEHRPYRGRTTDWARLEPTDSGYTGRLKAESGGWYRLEVRVDGKSGTPDVWRAASDSNLTGPLYPLTDYYQVAALVMHVGVGDLFLCCGQSNSANSGWPPQLPKDERVTCFDGVRWRPAYDPQPLATNHGGSPWPILGDMLVRSLQVPVAFVSIGQGGSRVSTWQPESEGEPLIERPIPGDDAPAQAAAEAAEARQPGCGPFEQLAKLAQAMGPNGFKAVLWHQGYSDARDGTTAEEYVEGMTNIIQTLDRDAGYHIPWVVAQESVAPYPKADSAAIRDAQQMLWKRGLALQGPNTDDLVGLTFRHDLDHFNELGLRIHAERWFALLWAQLYAVIPTKVVGSESKL